MNILSLFDGMSCGQIALNKVGIKYETYYSSEIDKDAIKVTQHNYPNTIQVGDVTKLSTTNLPKIDLLIGGSPCQGFSFVRNREAGIRRTKSYPLTGVDSEQAPQSIVFVFLFLCFFVVPRQGNSGEAEPNSEADR